jgi:hypothetical protein
MRWGESARPRFQADVGNASNCAALATGATSYRVHWRLEWKEELATQTLLQRP